MSDVMLFGVLRMPYDMAMSSELSRRQFYGRAQEAADRIESLEAEVERLTEGMEIAINGLQNIAAVQARSAPAAGTDKDAEPKPRRCKPCHSPRQGETCHKCGAPTFEPHSSWEEPALPPVDRIRELAREAGYAIGEHGTKERDLDLIAAPWTEEAIGKDELFEHIAKGIGARIIEMECKPLGRYAATLQMDGWYKNIDLSVCPIAAIAAHTSAGEAQA